MNQTTFSLTLKPSVRNDSIFLGKTMRERVPVDVVESFVQNQMGISFKQCKGKRYAGILSKFETEQSQMEAYLATYNKEGGYFETKYYIPTHGYGRIEPDDYLSLSKFRRPTRHAFAKKDYVDCDMRCAHPVLFAQICQAEGLPCSSITAYAKDCDLWREKIRETYNVEKDIAKELPIRLCFGGSIANWKLESVHPDYLNRDIAEVVELEKELAALMPLLFKANPLIASELLKYNPVKYADQNQLMRSVMSMWSQTVERLAQESVAGWLVREKGFVLEDIVPSQDGLMILKELWYPGILNDMAAVVRRDLDLGIEWAQKDFDKAITIPPVDKSRLPVVDKSIQKKRIYASHLLFNDVLESGMLADFFRDLYTDLFIFSNDSLYCYNGVYWKVDDKRCAALSNFVDTEFVKELRNYEAYHKAILNEQLGTGDKAVIDAKLAKLDKMASCISKLRKHSFRSSVIEDIKTKLTRNDIKFDNNPDLFAFQNAVYDLKAGAFKKPDPNDYISIVVDYNYDSNYPREKEGELMRFIDSILPDHQMRDYYLTILSTGLSGIQQQFLFVANGQGGNGKSCIDSLAMSMFSNYGYKLPSSLIQNPLKTGANPELANLSGKRFALTQEPDGSKRCCVSTLKELTGDDGINARGLYDSNTSKKICATFVMECNVKPRLDEVNAAVIRRIRVIPFTTTAIDKRDYDLLEDKTGYVVKVSHYSTDAFRVEYRQALFSILCRYYSTFIREGDYPAQPAESKRITAEYMASSDDFYQWFSSEYEQTNAACAPIATRDLLDKFKTTATYYTLPKTEQRNYTATKFNRLITDSVFIRPYFKDRKVYYNGKQLSTPSICGWTPIKRDTDNIEDGYTDDDVVDY